MARNKTCRRESRNALPSIKAFAHKLADRLRHAGVTGDIHYDAEMSFLRHDDFDPLYLGTAYRDYCLAGWQHRATVLDHYVAALLRQRGKIPENYDTAKRQLLPEVCNRAIYDLVALQQRVDGEMPPTWLSEPLGEHLSVNMVYDMPEIMRRIEPDHLEKWKVTFAEIKQTALANLRRMPSRVVAVQTGVHLFDSRDHYEPSRLLLPDTIRELRVAGDIVAVAPTRNTLIVTGSEDTDGLKCMLKLARHALNSQSGSVSTVTLRLTEQGWTPWLPELTHPLFHEIKAMGLQSLRWAYAKQQTLLNKLPGDGFVASFNVGEKNQQVLTYSTWTEGITSLLPRTDVIGFVQVRDLERGEVTIRGGYRWEQVVGVIGNLLKPLDMYPPRYEVSGFPTSEQLSAMGESVDPTTLFAT